MRTSPLPPRAVLEKAARSAWPERTFQRFRVHDEGWTNYVLEADDLLIFRFPRWKEVAQSLGYEVRVLDFLGQRLSTPIPQPVRLAVLAHPRGWPFLVYPKLPGRPLSTIRRLDGAGRRRLGAFVDSLLHELASLPAPPLLRMGASEGNPDAWAKKYRALEKRYQRHAESKVAAPLRPKLTHAFERFFADLRSARYRPIATHQDLGPDHLLWDDTKNRPTGVIDWEDLCLGDPAFDLTGLTLLGSDRLRAWTRARRSDRDSTFEERLAFYRAIQPLHGVLYAAETGDRNLFQARLSALKASFEA
jgi:aminoglycoside 2''-phosphotransferase